MNFQKYIALQKKADAQRRLADQAKGAEAQLSKQLKEEFNCDGIEAAQKLLKQVGKELASCEAEIEKELSKFEKDFGDALAD